MTAEEQAAEDERARAAALVSMASIGGLQGQTRSALAPVTEQVDGFDSEGMGPISIEPSSEPDPMAAPSTDLTRDHLGNPDPSSGSAFGPDDPSEAVSGPLPEAAPPPVATAIPTGPTTSPAVTGSTPQEATADPATAKPPMDPAREAAAGPLPTLDQGLPSEADISGARNGDVFRRIMHGLGAGLMVAGGRSAPAFQSQAEPLEAERRAGIREALQRKGVMRGQEQTAEAQSARQVVQQRLAERQAAQRDRGLDLQEQALPSRIAATEALTESRGASTDRTRVLTEETRAEVLRRTSTAEQRADPQSAASIGEREALEARLTLMGRDGERIREGLPDLSTLGADQMHEIRTAATSGVGIRGVGGGTGGREGGGAPRSDSRIAEAVRLHMFDSEDDARQHMAAVGAENFDRELVSRQNEVTAGESASARARTPLAEGEQGEEVFTGLHSGVRLAPGEGRAIRHDIGLVAGRMASLGRMRQIGQEFGWRGAISPEAAARVRPRLMALRSMAAQIQGTGVINPSEVETINASLPDPTDLSQMTFETLESALDEWQGMLEDTVRGNVGETGIGLQEGADALIRRLRASAERGAPAEAPTRTSPTATPSRQTTTSDTVRVIGPNGQRARAPRGAAMPQGWRLAD